MASLVIKSANASDPDGDADAECCVEKITLANEIAGMVVALLATVALGHAIWQCLTSYTVSCFVLH